MQQRVSQSLAISEMFWVLAGIPWKQVEKGPTFLSHLYAVLLQLK